jgi:hypothetical protein
MQDYQGLINDPRRGRESRLEALGEWATAAGALKPRSPGAEVNNHIHTIYSFSPYTPSMAALRAWEAGLGVAGSVDHDSVAAAEEMLAACALLGIAGSVGFEVRVSLKGPPGAEGPFARRKINNPDSEGLVYMTVQGIPRWAFSQTAEFLRPLREERLTRTDAMTGGDNVFLREGGMGEIGFEEEVQGRSRYDEGGGITERHLLAALGDRFIRRYGRGPALSAGLEAALGIRVAPKIRALLADPANPHYLYDLLGLLKAEFLPRIFIQPGEKECLPAERVTAFAASIGALPAYAYLGDVGESPTGDKRREPFEDGFIGELFAELSRRGYRGVTYMPPRNTVEQLRTVQGLAAKWGLVEIYGVDINSSRQSFHCPEVLREEFRGLLDNGWALAAHERLASVERKWGLFSPENPLGALGLPERLKAYAALGRALDLRRPEASAQDLIPALEQGRFQEGL